MGVFLGRDAVFVHLVITFLAEAMGCELCSGWDCSRVGCGTAHLQKVCLQSHLPRINTLLQWGLHRHRRDTYTCSENLEKITTCVFSKEFPSGLCTCLVGGQIVAWPCSEVYVDSYSFFINFKTPNKVLGSGLCFHLSLFGISRRVRWMSVILQFHSLKSFFPQSPSLSFILFCLLGEESQSCLCSKRIFASHFSKWFNALANARSMLDQAPCHTTVENCCCQKVWLWARWEGHWKSRESSKIPDSVLCAFLQTFLDLCLEPYSSLGK